MMDKKQITQIATDAETLFKTVMGLYSSYLEALESTIQKIPDTETDLLKDLERHLADVQNALKHDLAVFDKAIAHDKEGLRRLQDQLKINELHNQLH
jgi:hypothetical protein